MSKNKIDWVETISVTGSAPQHHLGGKKATLSLIKLANIHDRDRILVLGCGNGQTVFLIAKLFDCDIVGTDINPKSINSANSQLHKLKKPLKGKITFIVDDILKSNLEKEYFDKILIESVLIMLPKESILNILYNLLRRDGQICINEGLRISANEYTLKLVEEEFKKNGIDWSLPNYYEWTQLLNNSNFHVVFDTGPIPYNLIKIGVDSFLNHPVQSLKFIINLVKSRTARRFYLKIQKLMKNASIKWGYCLWVCNKKN